MKSEERNNLVAPCGIDCGICEMHTCVEGSDFYNRLIARGIPKEKIPCKGCRIIEGFCPVIVGKCDTYTCVLDKKVNFCYECDEFPCLKLHPSADRADLLPHNQKVYNLCTIQNKGLDHFVQISNELKIRYYTGKMSVGKGPQV